MINLRHRQNIFTESYNPIIQTSGGSIRNVYFKFIISQVA